MLEFSDKHYLGSSLRFGLPREQTKLKTSGPYRFSRNPIYLGLYLIIFAAALALNLWWAWAIAILNFIVYHRIIQAEESFLAEKFGDPYRDYCQSVRRYL
ncbi:isoprenylcysteine carboxylmethyltransferase family protein [Persicobacter sp. CCB-QB2]|uniref:methyltransferase family protein n=1 Tax=Persicobacter sp. CCB-QB2 TaxID=1561025 RepID=UPI0009E55D10|nr:isoprenylcysteine carboxylmethyltransferase family protein [Persicobacter sp. CCB-QB2]